MRFNYLFNFRNLEEENISKYEDNDLEPVTGPTIFKKKDSNNQENFQIIERNNNTKNNKQK